MQTVIADSEPGDLPAVPVLAGDVLVQFGLADELHSLGIPFHHLIGVATRERADPVVSA